MIRYIISMFFVVLVAIPTISLAVETPATLPIWYTQDGFTKEGTKAVEILKTSKSHGIPSSRYDLGLFEEQKDKKISDAAELKNINSKVTQSLIAYMLDLRFGLTKSQNAITKLSEEEKASYQAYFEDVINHLIKSDNPESAIQNFVEGNEQYTKLQDALNRLYTIKENNQIKPVKITKSIKLNDEKPEVADVRNNLKIIDYAMTGKTQPKSASVSNVFDDELSTEVKQFQENNGLSADGNLGAQTAAKMNTYIDDSIAQIEFTLDKIRSDKGISGDKYILVNIPEFKLYGYDQNKISLEMPVIVGQIGKETPELQNHIQTMVLNPDWTPTDKIMKNELIPKLRKSSKFFTAGGFEIRWRDTNQVISQADYDSIDWSKVSNSNIKIKQTSGSHNALGKIKFLMPNSDNIYLHDTSTRGLFKNAYRALSHGCIRLGEPLKLAEFVLGATEFKHRAIEKIINSGKSQALKTAEIPVFVIYHTAWVDSDGNLKLGQDVYKKGKNFEAVLAKAKPIEEGIIASVSPNPRSDWASVNVHEFATAVNTSTP